MDKKKYLVNGACILCATAECNDLCHHYGAAFCLKTLKKIGEKFYLNGLDDLGIKYYSMALYAEKTLGYDKKPKTTLVKKKHRKMKGASHVMSIQERYRQQEAIRAAIGGGRSTRGLFGAFMPKPINRISAMSFQKQQP